MAYKWIGQEWCPDAKDYSKKFMLDTDDDAKELPKCCPGSEALAPLSGNLYVVNASGAWVKFGSEA